MKDYLAIIEPAADGTWGAYVPDLPGCTSGGVTRDEAVRNIHSAIVGHIQVLRENGDRVPEPTSLPEVVHVA
ncbi:MAG TPA: type II toxin-antitoxin system HicB family antitoxin [Candidatus Baltobacteraceae bacterium]|nr:type II toxin-antitoxin system HicB family antitoxin [Candidatus Baltobacteraceae bacterium]